jgi:hypothetical protein
VLDVGKGEPSGVIEDDAFDLTPEVVEEARLHNRNPAELAEAFELGRGR